MQFTLPCAPEVMRLFRLPALMVLVFLATSCADNVTLDGVDAARFAADKDGCSGYRAETIGTIEKAAQALVGKNQATVKATLGNPDVTDLGSRSQRYYVYHLTPALGCKGYQLGMDSVKTQFPKELTVRFNSLDRVSEVSIRMVQN